MQYVLQQGRIHRENVYTSFDGWTEYQAGRLMYGQHHPQLQHTLGPPQLQHYGLSLEET